MRRFIEKREDALFLGPPGTGKSHLAQAIGRAAIQQGYRVLYREAHTLIEEIADATLDGTRKKLLADLAAVPLLIPWFVVGMIWKIMTDPVIGPVGAFAGLVTDYDLNV